MKTVVYLSDLIIYRANKFSFANIFSLLILLLLLASCADKTPMEAHIVESRTRNGSTDKDTSTTILPESLHIPAIGLKLSVEPMGWEVTAIGDEQLTTQWQLPDSTIGWHTNSAYAGAGGNVVLSGHHLYGEQVFDALALGWLEIGQQIVLINNAEQAFRYEIIEITEPILSRRGTSADIARSTSYVGKTDQAQLTLITGWPSFSTTHRIFIVAKLISAADYQCWSNQKYDLKDQQNWSDSSCS